MPSESAAATGTRTRIALERVRAARAVIDPLFLDSPQFRCEALDPIVGCELTLKLETANPVRSFKARATEVVTSGLVAAGARRIVCASAGNLGQALAWSGRQRNLAVTVVAPRTATPVKLQRIRQFGAELELVDGDHETARARAAEIAEREGIRLLEDSLDLETCEGAATMGLELAREAVPFDAVLISLGGGAMATGVGAVLRELSPTTAVVCVQPAGAPAMTLSWRARRVITTETAATIADGVAARHPIQAVLDDLVVTADDALLVSEEAIVQAVRALYTHAGLVVEPAAALGVAALLEDPARFAHRRVATIICGGNVDPDRFRGWVSPPTAAGSAA